MLKDSTGHQLRSRPAQGHLFFNFLVVTQLSTETVETPLFCENGY